MKKIILTLCLLVASVSGAVGGWNINGKPTADWFSGEDSFKNVPLWWMRAADPLISSMDVPVGTGSIFYVDSGVTNEGDGSSLTNAKNTLDEAIDLCVDARGDVIYVAQGHAENLSTAGTVTCDKSGVTIIGCGNGSNRPTFTTTATAGTFLVSDSGVTIIGLRFAPGISAVVSGISVTATGDYFLMYDCEFVDPGTATYEYYDMVTLASGADYITLLDNRFISTVTSTGCNDAISVDAGVVNRLVIAGNEFQGNFAEAAIHSDQINTNALIWGNTVYQSTTGQVAIEFTAATTGICAYNTMYTDTWGTAGVGVLDPGSLTCYENYGSTAIDKPAVLVPSSSTGQDVYAMLMGTDGIGTFPSGTAATNSVSLAEVLRYVQENIIVGSGTALPSNTSLYGCLAGATGVTTYPSAAAYGNAVSLAEVTAYIQDAVRNGSGTAMASNKSVADALGTNGTTLVDDAASIAGVLGYNDNDNAYASSNTASNRDGSILERLEFLCKYFETGTAGGLVAPADTRSLLDILGSDGTTTTGALAGSLYAAIGTNEVSANTTFSSSTVQPDADGSVLERQEYLQDELKWQLVQQAYGNATSGSAHPVAFWFVDTNIEVSGDGKTPFTAFKTIDEAITACSNTVEDFIIVWDYSGSAATITMNKSWVHLIGMHGSTHPYPRIAATTGHGITLSNGVGRIEICGFTIGAQSTKAGIGLDSGAASQVYVHDCHFGIDLSSACQEGIYVANGADAVDLVVENCEFKTAITQEGIEIAGNATWARIRDNLFIGCTASNAYPAVNLSGSVVGIAVENNRIGGGSDDGVGWGITVGAGSSDCWIDGNHVNDGKTTVGNNPFEDGAANAWGLNYADITATLP